jgi:beta-lactamase class A
LNHPASKTTFFHRADVPMPTASLCKLPIMVEAYFQIKEGKVNKDQLLNLTKEDMVPGSGILTSHFSPGTQISLRDAIRLMIRYSDNTATNLVLDRIGIRNVNDRMKSLGFPESQVHSKVFKRSTSSVDLKRSEQYGLGSTTANDMVQLLEKLHNKKVIDPATDQIMIEHLLTCDDEDKFPRFLPKGFKIAHKTGSVSDAKTDAGIVYFKSGTLFLCVLTNKNKDNTYAFNNLGDRFCADVAKLVYDHLETKNPPKGNSP